MAYEGQIAAVQSAGAVRILNCVPSAQPEEDWGLRAAQSSGLALADAPVPTSKDLRDDSWWHISDQGATGSCVGWAVADSILRWHCVQSGYLSRQDQTLSPRFIWMASKEIDEFTTEPSTFIEQAGTSLKAALDVARRYGAVRESVLPFASSQLYTEPVNTFYALATQLKIAAYFNLGRNLQDWKAWLANNGPILVRLSVDRTWDMATQNGGRLDVYKTETARGGHAVALVGYTPDTVIVRNSWGVGWGANGYAHASLTYASAAFTEAYGISLVGGGQPREPDPAKPRRSAVWHR
ncbi:C1 family peptidase [Nakamurella sp. GG22]